MSNGALQCKRTLGAQQVHAVHNRSTGSSAWDSVTSSELNNVLTMGKVKPLPHVQSLNISTEIKKYCDILDALLKEFDGRFSDLEAPKSKLGLFSLPYSIDSENVPVRQLELSDLRCDSNLQKACSDNINAPQTGYQKFAAEIVYVWQYMNLKCHLRANLSGNNLTSALRLASVAKVSPNNKKLV